MLGHMLMSVYRSQARNKLYTVLNGLGLGLGIAVFLVLALVVNDETSFDRWLPGADTLYRVDGIWSNGGHAVMETDGVAFAALEALQADAAGISAGTRLSSRQAVVSVGPLIDGRRITAVDPNFLDVIELPLAAGARGTALSRPDAVVLTQAAARRYFGTMQALGRSLDITLDGVRRSYLVSAVLRDIPSDSTLAPSVLIRRTPVASPSGDLLDGPDGSAGEVYLKMPDRDAAARLVARMPGFIGRWAAATGRAARGEHPERYYQLSLVRLTDAHLHDAALFGGNGTDPRLVWSLGGVGVLALLAAVVNTVNLATARAGSRACDVAVRKVMGATQRLLTAQFLAENIALVGIATLIGLALTELAVPLVNALDGSGIVIPYRRLLLWLPPLVLLLAAAAGLYPALILARFQPAAVLASARNPASVGGQRLRTILVTLQFVCATGCIACALVIDAQARYLGTADRGFDPAHLIVVDGLGGPELRTRQAAIMDRFRRVPGVVSATVSDRAPSRNGSASVAVFVPGHVGEPPALLHQTVGIDYFRTYGIAVLAGRAPDAVHRQDDRARQPGPARSLNGVVSLGALPGWAIAMPARRWGATSRSSTKRAPVPCCASSA